MSNAWKWITAVVGVMLLVVAGAIMNHYNMPPMAMVATTILIIGYAQLSFAVIIEYGTERRRKR